MSDSREGGGGGVPRRGGTMWSGQIFLSRYANSRGVTGRGRGGRSAPSGVLSLAEVVMRL